MLDLFQQYQFCSHHSPIQKNIRYIFDKIFAGVYILHKIHFLPCCNFLYFFPLLVFSSKKGDKTEKYFQNSLFYSYYSTYFLFFFHQKEEKNRKNVFSYIPSPQPGQICRKYTPAYSLVFWSVFNPTSPLKASAKLQFLKFYQLG